jgi:hypothetical protein
MEEIIEKIQLAELEKGRYQQLTNQGEAIYQKLIDWKNLEIGNLRVELRIILLNDLEH